MTEKKIAIKVEHVSKSFYGSKALDDVSLEFYESEVHIICGENGAGKSTLMKILSGLYIKDEGRVEVFGEPYNVSKPADAEKMGVATIHQESNLSLTNTVAENIFLHREPGKWLVDRKRMNTEAKKYLDRVGAHIAPTAATAKLSTANQQLVQIAKALSQNARILIMDEPVSSISEEDTTRLFELINKLKKDGLTVLYIDHRLSNFKRIGDRVSVLRDGKMVGSAAMADITNDDIIKMMVGRSLSNIFTKTNIPTTETILEIKDYQNERLNGVSFSVRKGEVFGLAGLVGAGRSEIVRAIFGVDKLFAGETFVDGVKTGIKTPQDAIRHGLAFVPEDRKAAGFVPGRNTVFNLCLASFENITRFLGLIDRRKELQEAGRQIESLQIRTLNDNVQVKELSGGNQQKVVIGKWLMREDIRVFLMDEPTRGIDVGVKMEIYKLIDAITAAGNSVILITSEMTELIGMSDRIAAICEGRVTQIFEKEEFTQEAILKACI